MKGTLFNLNIVCYLEIYLQYNLKSFHMTSMKGNF